MSSAFKAEAIHEFKARDKSKIESLLAEGDRLLVGLNTGSLRVYRVNDDTKDVKEQDDTEGRPSTPVRNASTKAIELLREEERFSKKPVLQLAIIKEANLLISLSDGHVSFHDLQTYELVEKLEQTKGAVCFVVNRHVVRDPETDVPSLVSRLAVGVRKKVLSWTWQDSELTQDILDVTMEAAVKTLTWSTGTQLVVGMDPGFSLLNLESQEVTPINKPASRIANDAATTNGSDPSGVRFAAVSSSGMSYMGMSSWVPKPMATPMANSEVLLAKDVNTLFINVHGTPLEKRQVPWHQAPEAIGYSYPYLLSLLPPDRGVLQVRNPDSLSLLQKIPLPGANILHVPQPNISLAHAGKGFLVASERTIWRMNALPYPAQIKELVDAGKYDEAISFLGLLEDTLIDDKAGRIREVKIQKAMDLFHQQSYRPSLDLMTDAQAPVERVVALYPAVISGDLSPASQDMDDVVSENGSSLKGAEAASLKEISSPSKGMFGRLLPSGQARVDTDAASTKTPARTHADNASIRSKATPAKRNETGSSRPLEGDDLKTAVHALSSFLAQARQVVRKYLNLDGSLKEAPPKLDPETHRPAFSNLLRPGVFEKQFDQIDWHAELLAAAQLVDTTLFKAYMLAVPSLAGPLFRQPNFCDPDVVRDILYEHDRYSDLIDFLHGKRLHRQALELLQKFGKDEADAEVPEGMRGLSRTIAYLKQLPAELIDIILDFIRWPIEQDPETSMEVFVDDSVNAETLPAKRVVAFLAEVDEKLETQYLEHIIQNLRNQDADFHQRLVDLYLRRLKSAEADEDKAKTQSNLQSLLQKSRLYNKAKTFRQLPADDPLFYESRAIVLSAMGNHKQALSIYVYQIQDYEKAEDYCNKLYLSDQSDQGACLVDRPSIHQPTSFRLQPDSEESQQKFSIFAILLGLYLRPPPDEAKRWPQALDLLSKHGARLPASSTLDLMPDNLAVQELTDYFRGRIRSATSVLREGRVVRSLTSVKRDNTERQLLIGTDQQLAREKNAGRNRRVRITEEDHCKVCHKRFGASAIRVYPDNTVVHYGCAGKRLGEQRTWG